MNRTDAPSKQSKPFGVNGQREPLLETTPAGDNTASYDQGFPPITMTLKSAGGLPPKGQDMNQILYELSSLARWASTNAINRYDATFSTAIGGYQQDALVLGDDGITVWRSNVNNNTNNPNTLTTGWVKLADDISAVLQLGTAAKRDVGNGTNQIPDINSWSSGSGWRMTPDGYIEQWGQSATVNATTGVAVATFPIPFPTGCLSVQISEVTSSTTGNSGVKSWGVSMDTLTKTGVSGILDVTGGAATSEFFIYRAIGR